MSDSASGKLSRRIHQTRLVRMLLTLVVLLLAWQLLVIVLALPAFILPSPQRVIERLWQRHDLLHHGWVTLQEILGGLLLGISAGMLLALQMLLVKPLRRWLLPLLIVSQAIPVFALAPILMLWLGYGMASKVVMEVGGQAVLGRQY